MVAALFALHPINVESVAWAAERKNVLSMLFLLLALWAYGWYATQTGARRYAAVACLFALSLLAKPQAITFPFLLLLWDYWPLDRMGAPDKSAQSGACPGFAANAPAGEGASFAALRGQRGGHHGGSERRARRQGSCPFQPAVAHGNNHRLVCALSGQSILAGEAGRALSAPPPSLPGMGGGRSRVLLLLITAVASAHATNAISLSAGSGSLAAWCR